MRKSPSLTRLAVPASLLLAALALLVRGFVALSNPPDTEQSGEPEITLTLYDVRADRVRTLPLEEYIKGVVAAEMPASFAVAALEAQAVAARTYAVHRLVRFGGSPCGRHGAQLCSGSDCCQAWRSDEELEERWGEDAAFYSDKLSCAVEATAGVVALYDGEPIDALYHSSSGGETEDARLVFGGDVPYLVSVPSPGEENASHFTDVFRFTPKEFARLVNKTFPKAALSSKRLDRQLEPLSVSETGRVLEMRVGKTTLTGRELRSALGLSSTAFTISLEGDLVIIRTRGFGHGVGMSQFGADAMARAGADFWEILSHYYTGITLGTLDVSGAG